MTQPAFKPDLYLVTDRAMCASRGVVATVREAVAAGVTMVQLRDNEAPDAEVEALARELLAVLVPKGIPLLIDNRVELAAAVGAQGAHVGASDTAPAVAREILGPDAILGLSITHLGQLAAVDPAIVDYLGVGPIFPTSTKPDAAEPLGLLALRDCRRAITLPIVAIGGISAANVASVIGAGADGVAVVGAICGAPDVRAATAQLVREIGIGRKQSAVTH